MCNFANGSSAALVRGCTATAAQLQPLHSAGRAVDSRAAHCSAYIHCSTAALQHTLRTIAAAAAVRPKFGYFCDIGPVNFVPRPKVQGVQETTAVCSPRTSSAAILQRLQSAYAGHSVYVAPAAAAVGKLRRITKNTAASKHWRLFTRY